MRYQLAAYMVQWEREYAGRLSQCRFVVAQNNVDRHRATSCKTMIRQVGRIKWFGGVNRKTGRENHFGFIARAGKTDLYVHRRDVCCAIAQLTEDIPVTFELSEEPGSLYAVAVGLLQDETDLNMLADCFESNEYIQFVAQRYLNALDPEQAIAAITRRFP